MYGNRDFLYMSGRTCIGIRLFYARPTAEADLNCRHPTHLTSRVRIDYFTQKPSSIFIPGRQDCAYCEDVRVLMEEVASLSERITLTTHDVDQQLEVAKSFGVDKVPGIVVRGQTNRPIRFFGVPAGTGFPAFIETLLDAARGTVTLLPKTAQQLATATGLPQSEVQATLSNTAQAVERVRDNPAQAAAEALKGVADLYAKARSTGAVERKAEELQPAMTRGAWASFGALVLSLAAAVIGAMAGRRKYIPCESQPEVA